MLGLLAAHSLLPPSLENCLAWEQSKAGLAKGTINTKAIASVWDCSNEHPVGLAEASAVSSLWVRVSLCPVLPTAVPYGYILWEHFPAILLCAISHFCLLPGTCPFIPVIALKENCIVVHATKTPRNSFSCPFCIQFFLLTFSHFKSTVVGSYGLQPRIGIYTMPFSCLLLINFMSF